MKITWLGHGTFKIVSAEGKTIVIDPWIEGNPASPAGAGDLDRLDLILLTHGHFDHVNDAAPLAKKHSPKIVGIYELCSWLESKGVQNCIGMNKGGTLDLDGIRVTMVDARHSSSAMEDGRIVYLGEAAGYVLGIDGRTLYFSGDTCVFGDMRLIAEIYQPELCFLPIGDLYTMGPREAAAACRMLKPKVVVPMHYGTFPPLTGRPVQVRELLKDMPELDIKDIQPGAAFEW